VTLIPFAVAVLSFQATPDPICSSSDLGGSVSSSLHDPNITMDARAIRKLILNNFIEKSDLNLKIQNKKKSFDY